MNLNPPRYADVKSQIDLISNRNQQYQKLLETYEWEVFRFKVLKNDQYKCVKCGREDGPIFKSDPSNSLKEEIKKVRERNQIVRDNRSKYSTEYAIDLLIKNPDEYSSTFLELAEPTGNTMIGRVVLQVHHKLYFENKLPWEYKFTDLVTLCQDCHEEVHRNEIIYTYFDESKSLRKSYPKCLKCGGTGHLPHYHYWAQGICFGCGGRGIIYDSGVDWIEVKS